MSLEGQLEDLGLTDILQILSLSKRSGELSIKRKEETGYVFFSKGNIVFGSAPKAGSFGIALVKKGLITQEMLTQATTIQNEQKKRKPIGTILVDLGIKAEVIEQELIQHFMRVARDLLSWRKGFFHFELGAPIEDEIVLSSGMSAEFLLLEGARLSDEENRDGLEEDEEEDEPKEKAPAENVDAIAVVESEPPRPFSFQDEIQRETELEKSAPESGNSARKDLQLLNTMIDELSSPSSGGEIILLILRFASELLNRTMVLLIKKEEVMGWGQCGFDLPGKSADDEIRKIKIALSEESVFKTVVRNKKTHRGVLEKNAGNNYMVNHLGGNWPQQSLVIPVFSEGRVIAFVYGDNTPVNSEIGEVEGLESFIKVAGFAFGRMMGEKKVQK